MIIAGLHFPWCGAGVGLNIEGCGAVRGLALNDCAVRCGCGLLHCGVVRSWAKLLGPRRALIRTDGRAILLLIFYSHYAL